ncbi:MAG: hypothetical protein AAFU61_12915, partial [Pseudomonadota bacterium]
MEIKPRVAGPGNAVVFESPTCSPQSARDPRTFVDVSLASADAVASGERIRDVEFGRVGGFIAGRVNAPPDLCAAAPGAGRPSRVSRTASPRAPEARRDGSSA